MEIYHEFNKKNYILGTLVSIITGFQVINKESKNIISEHQLRIVLDSNIDRFKESKTNSDSYWNK